MIERAANKIYTEQEMAQLLRTSPKTLRGLRQVGRLHFLRIGRAILYPDQYLQEYIDRYGASPPDGPIEMARRKRG